MSISSNTEILIKRSLANSAPSTLRQGELAFSYASNTLFIGSTDGSTAFPIGSYNDFSANYLNGANTYGSTTEIPVITIAANGLITNVTTSTISTTLNIGDGTNTDTVNLVDGTLLFTGQNGITTSVTDDEVTIGVDDTIVRSNTESVGPQHISTDVLISGNLTVQGTTTYVDTAINQTSDSMIELAANNTVGDVLDIGFYGKHEGVDGTVVTGLVRNAGTSDFYLFDNIALGDQTDLTSNLITQGAMSANGASLYTYKFLATQSQGGTEGGYSFSGNEGGLDTGMFSPTDGQLQFWSNNVKSGEINPDNGGTSFGFGSAQTNQGYRAISLGYEAGQTNQNNFATAVGLHAGQNNQGTAAVAVGHSAGQDSQGQDTIAIGSHAGQNTQGYRATSVGYRAGYGNNSGQGQYSVALGTFAGYDSQAEYSIAINASGNNLNPTEAGLYIDPIRANNATGGNVTVYNATTKEVVYTDVTINDSGITLENGTVISGAASGLFVDSLNADETGNIVFYNTTTKELTYGSMADLRPDRIANNSFFWEVDGTNGSLFSNNGVYIADSVDSVIIGQNVDLTNTNTNRVAIGNNAANTGQGYGSTAVGENAGQTNQGYLSVAVGLNAGNDTQGHSAVAIGHTAGRTSQGNDAVAIGVAAGQTNQGQYALAVGERAGYTGQGQFAVSLGSEAGYTNQTQYAVAIGYQAGSDTQSEGAVAVGQGAGQTTQAYRAVAVGHFAGYNNQGYKAVAVGKSAGEQNQGQDAVAVGHRAGNSSQSLGGVAVGYHAGDTSQGQYSIAIGYRAGLSNQVQNSIVLDAMNSALSPSESGLYINPIRYTETQDASDDAIMFYNQSTKEIRYSYALDGGSF